MENVLSQIKYDEKGLVPVVTQDIRTDEVLMVAYMNREALSKSLETGMVHYFSRSRNSLWLKGETSGHYQKIKSISVDCDGDTLLVKVEQKGAACHTGHHSCFFRKFDSESIGNADTCPDMSEQNTDEQKQKESRPENTADLSGVLQEVYDVVKDRKANPKEGSYTNYLFEKGPDKILKKVGEEAAEVIIAAKNQENGAIKAEIGDLLYHLMVLMVERGIPLNDIYEELKSRR